MENFWKKLHKPIFCLAPMADVTDCAFRQITAKCGKPDIFWTEFVSADGLMHPKARKKLLIDLKFSKEEHPIVAQLFGSNAENMKKAAILCEKLGFNGIDINMGCPDKSIEKQNSGAAMIKNSRLAREIIRAVRAGAKKLPVSVKTRISYNSPPLKDFGRTSKNGIYLLNQRWIRELLEENLAALVVHLRTRKEMSNVPAHWDLMPEIIKLRDKINPETLIIGNGDVADIEDAKQKVKKYGCDGVMLGRAIFGNPWLFSKKNINSASSNFSSLRPSPGYRGGTLGKLKIERSFVFEKLKVLVEHTKLFEKLLGGVKSFSVMKKHFKAYVNGFDGAKELRTRLMETNNAKEVEKTIKNFLQKPRQIDCIIKSMPSKEVYLENKKNSKNF